MARPANAEKMIESLSATAEAKARLTAIVMTLAGAQPVPDACAELGIGEARFHEMRKEFLAEALGLLERKTAGRKPADAAEDAEERLAELEEENRTLEVELEAARIRTEIALTMPRLLKRRLAKDKDEDTAAPAGAGIGLPSGLSSKKKKRRR